MIIPHDREHVASNTRIYLPKYAAFKWKKLNVEMYKSTIPQFLYKNTYTCAQKKAWKYIHQNVKNVIIGS